MEYFAPSPSFTSFTSFTSLTSPSEYVVVDLIDHFGEWNVVSEQNDQVLIQDQSPQSCLVILVIN